MATIKAFTDLQQSKKLAEILPLESADMFFSGYTYPKERHLPTFSETSIKDNTPCWSLAALLGILPIHLIINNQRYAFSMIKGLDKNGETYAIKYCVFNTSFYLHLTNFHNNPVDACYEMIFKLHELNLL